MRAIPYYANYGHVHVLSTFQNWNILLVFITSVYWQNEIYVYISDIYMSTSIRYIHFTSLIVGVLNMKIQLRYITKQDISVVLDGTTMETKTAAFVS